MPILPNDKKLLIKDLCARLPYGVKFAPYEEHTIAAYCICKKVYMHENGHVIIDLLYKDSDENTLAFNSINLTITSRLPKIYLRPMSSMTKEEFKSLENYSELKYDQLELTEWENNYTTLEFWLKEIPNDVVIKVFDWLNAHHFDYRNLIPQGLAIAVTEENNPYDNNP